MATFNRRNWFNLNFSRVQKPIFRNEQLFFRPRIESLENRLAPAIDLLQVANQIDTILQGVENALTTIDSAANHIPIIDKAFSDIPDVVKTVKDVRTELKKAIKLANPDNLEQTIKQKILEAIGPQTVINILADSSGNGVVDARDVGFRFLTAGGFEVQLDLVKSFTVSAKQQFGFGLDGLPFEVTGNPGVQLQIDFAYQDLTFGWDNNAPFFKAETPNELQIGLGATVTGGLQGTLGFINVLATAVAPASGQHHLDLKFTMDIASNGSISNPVINGKADVTLNLKAEITNNFPSIGADLNLQWVFINTSMNATKGAFGNDPVLALNHVTVSLGSILSDMIGPIIDVLQPILAPLQPVIDVLKYPIPLLSDIYEVVSNGETLALLDLVKTASALNVIPPSYKELTDITIDVLIPLAELIDDIGSSGDELMIDFGNFNLKTLANGKDLRLLSPLNGSGSLKNRISDLSIKSLQNDFDKMLSGFDYATIESLIDKLPDFVNKELLKEKLQKLRNGVSFSFPFLDNPAQGVVSVLMGNDVDLFTFKAQAMMGSDNPTDVASFSLPMGLSIGFTLVGKVDALFEMGYDTRGLRQFIGSGDVSEILDGFWISNDSHLDVKLSLVGFAGIDVIVFSAGVSGGIFGDLHVGMAQGDLDGKVHIISELDACLFEASGSLNLGLSAFMKVGVDIPFVGFIGLQKNFDIANYEIISFAIGGCSDNPFKNDKPIQLAGRLTSQLPAQVETQLAFPSDHEKTKVFFLTPGTNGVLQLNTGVRANNRKLNDPANNVDVTEAYGITHYEPAVDEVLPPGAPAGEIILVSAFGITEKYYGVKEIHSDLGLGNDTIKVNAGVQAKLVFNGQDGDDKIVSYGSGNSTFKGGKGNDTLIGGTGINSLNGDEGNDNLKGNGQVKNTLNGGADSDVLEGGLGQNALFGGEGNDTLNSFGNLANILDGGPGNDLLNTGLGDDLVLGGIGNDKITWQVGNGSPWIDGGAGYDSVGILGSDADESFSLLNAFIVPGFESQIDYESPDEIVTPVVLKLVEDLAISGKNGVDSIFIGALQNSSLKKIGVNLGDIISPDGVKDQITVEGTQIADEMAISLEDKVKLYEHSDIPTFGGVTVIAMGRLNIYAVNILDQVNVTSFGGNDKIRVSGISGPTKINTGSGDDLIYVSASEADQFLGRIVIDGGVGKNYFEFSDTVPGGTHIIIKNDEITSKNIPFGASVSWASPGPHDIVVNTGASDDNVQVKATDLLSILRVNTKGGADSVIVGDIVFGKKNGGSALALIKGSIFLDTGSGANDITIDDQTATTGHGNVIVNATQVLNFAPKPINYVSTGGSLDLILFGSNSVNLAEIFRIQSPNAGLMLFANAGKDTIRFESVTQLTTTSGGPGEDIFQFSNGVLSLSPVVAPVILLGDEGTDVLLVNDQGSPAGQSYAFTQSSLIRSGAGPISFSNIEKMEINAGKFNDSVNVMAIPKPVVMFHGGGGTTDSIFGPNSNSTWLLNGANAGSLNDSFSFKNFEALTGGTGTDLFKPNASAVFLGNLFGGPGADTLDYATFSIDIRVNLTTSVASQVSGGAFGFENIVSGNGNDILIGNMLSNRFYGGNGNDILIGKEGNDELYGGNGNDILIGGIGADSIIGGFGEDILIGERTIHDDNLQALILTIKEWSRTDLGYSARVKNIRNGGGLNGNTKLNETAMIYDNISDNLVGGNDLDWFWVKAGIDPDLILDKQSLEITN